MTRRGNPFHKSSGPQGGQFTAGGSGSSSKSQPAKKKFPGKPLPSLPPDPTKDFKPKSRPIGSGESESSGGGGEDERDKSKPKFKIKLVHGKKHGTWKPQKLPKMDEVKILYGK